MDCSEKEIYEIFDLVGDNKSMLKIRVWIIVYYYNLFLFWVLNFTFFAYVKVYSYRRKR